MSDQNHYNQFNILVYFLVLRRPKEEGVGVEDLDRLQIELEMLLSNVVLRQRTLHSEIEQMSTVEETRFKRTNVSVSRTVSIVTIVGSKLR